MEQEMKTRGEERIWKKIISRNGSIKNVVQTQEGQKLIFDDAIDVYPLMRDWIDNKSANVYRKELLESFPKQDENEPNNILLQKIVETMLLLSASTKVNVLNHKRKTRHKSIRIVQEKITPKLSFENTWRFVEMVVSYSTNFELLKTVDSEGNFLVTNVSYNCLIDEIIVDKLEQEANSAFFPEPMTEKPVDWSFENGVLKGGYKTYQYEMIRAKKKYLDYSKYPQNIFDSVNFIQSTAWKVYDEVLEAIKKDLKMPVIEDFLKSSFPEQNPDCKWDLDLKSEETVLEESERKKIEKARKEYYQEVEIYNAEKRDFESEFGKYRALKLAIGIADRYSHQVIYFPHSFDFRGRIYPLPIGLSPQGSDAIKAMLCYAEGEVLTKDGEDWAWAYLASLHGEDKITFKERIQLGKMLIDADYHDADEPYQFLQHQLELKKFLKDKNHKFVGRIHLDACASGSQITSVITGDEKGCRATNIIPNFNDDNILVRNDIYLLVCAKTKKLISEQLCKETDSFQIELLKFFLKILEENGRKICKRPVMTSVYGSSAGGRMDMVFNMLREMKCDKKFLNKKCAAVLSKSIGDSITGVLNGGKVFEKYIQQMNNVIAKGNKPVTWTTEDGFYVVHVKNKELKPKQIQCTLPGARRPTVLLNRVYSNDVAPTKMKSAISPNYVHSLDAQLLRRTALAMKKDGYLKTDFIHDSFGCLPNGVTRMLELTKETFIEIMKNNPLKQLDIELRHQIVQSKSNDKKLEKIVLPFQGESSRLVGRLKDSEWFFS